VDVLAQELVQHARELALKHDGEHGGMGISLANRVDFLSVQSAPRVGRRYAMRTCVCAGPGMYRGSGSGSRGDACRPRCV
jgi:hypothetical protein